jgi:hypothetical protein
MKSYDRGVVSASALVGIAAAFALSGCSSKSVEAGSPDVSPASSSPSQQTYEEPTVAVKTKIPHDAPYPSTFSPTPTTTSRAAAEKPGAPCQTFPGFELVNPNAKATDDKRREVRLPKNTICTVGLTALSGGPDKLMQPGEVMIVQCVREGVGNTPGVDLVSALPDPVEYRLDLTGMEAATILVAPRGGMLTCPIQ